MRHPQQAEQGPLGDADGGTPTSPGTRRDPVGVPEREGTHATHRVVAGGTDTTLAGSDQAGQAGRAG